LYDGRIISELQGDAINEKNIVAASLNIAGQKSEGGAHVGH